MNKRAFIGIEGLARKVNRIYVGVNGKARKVAKGYIGVNGKARLFWVNWQQAYSGGYHLEGEAETISYNYKYEDCNIDWQGVPRWYFTNRCFWIHQTNASPWTLMNVLTKPIFPPPYQASIWYSYNYIMIPVNRMYRNANDSINFRYVVKGTTQIHMGWAWINSNGTLSYYTTYANITEDYASYEWIWRNYQNPPDHVDYLIIGATYNSADKYLSFKGLEFWSSRTYYRKATHDLDAVITEDIPQPVKFVDVDIFYIENRYHDPNYDVNQVLGMRYTNTGSDVYKIGYIVQRGEHNYLACTFCSLNDFSVTADFSYYGAEYYPPEIGYTVNANEETYNGTTFYYYNFIDESYYTGEIEVEYDDTCPSNLCDDNLVVLQADDKSEQADKMLAVACLVMDGEWNT
jgi:hypothetical protein